MKKIKYTILLISLLCFNQSIIAQNIPQHQSYTRIYDFMDELATDGLIEINSAIKPYSRDYIAERLLQARMQETKLNKRQIQDLEFFMSEFAQELNIMPKAYVHYTDSANFDLSLLQPQFIYNNTNKNPKKSFKFQLRPILGMDLMYNSNGLLMNRRFGFDLQMDIVNHVSIWGSYRDESFSGDFLNKDKFPSIYDRIDCAKLSQPDYLYNLPGREYKESNYGGDFSDVRGGIRAYAWFGSIGLVKDNIEWGDTYNCSNILSGRAPSFPMIELKVTPIDWFEFTYIHGWLVSNVLDSTRYFMEETHSPDGPKKHYLPSNKYIAANMFTFRPIPKLNLSIGNSIIYTGDVKPIFFIPFAYFKSLDHLLTKGVRTENSNAQIFLNISSRNIKHLHLYFSMYIDEFSIKRWALDNPEKNLISFKTGFAVSNWPLKNLSYGFEYTRSNALNYKHSIQTITWASNSYNMGHYLGDNSQEFYAHITYKPIRSMNIKLSYTKAQKGKDYEYLRSNVEEIISQVTLDELTWENDIVQLEALYEIWPNAYAVVRLEYNNARGYDLTSEPIEGENRLDAQGYLDKFTPDYYKGENFTVTAGLSIGF